MTGEMITGETKPSGGAPDAKPRRWVLVVDDEPGFRDMLKWYLSDHDLDVEVAKDGAEAMARAAGGKYSLVITDLTMPKLDGLKLLEEIKQKRPDISVIVVTGFGTVETAVHAMKGGASDFILKPFNLDHLLVRIKEALFG
ncbi:MAG: response regulator [Elusimicrobia bacterium]|nr:response regulator [Elusimicrobiota bacterium]